MAGLPWYPHYPGDYGRDTRQLSLIEHGAYRLLMDYYYSNGSLPSGTPSGRPSGVSGDAPELLPNHVRLYRMCGAVTEQEMHAIDYVLDTFFTREGDSYVHSKIEEVIEKQSLMYEQKRAASEKAKEAREKKQGKKKPKGSPRGKPSGSPADTSGGSPCGTPNQNQNQNQVFGIDKSIPQGIDRNLWCDFMEVRAKSKKAACTDNALNLIIKELEKFKNAGHDPNQALRESIMNGWVGVFEPKTKNAKGAMKHGNFGEQDYTAGTEGFIVE